MQHPERDDLEQFLAGVLPAAESRALQRHLFICPECEERLTALLPGPAHFSPPTVEGEDASGLIRRLLDDRRPEIAVLRRSLAAERRAAPGLWREVERQDLKRSRSLVREDPRFQSWGFFELLVDRAYETVPEDVRRAEEILRLALAVAKQLAPEVYGPGSIETARTRAWTWLGNALRVQGNFREAERAFQTAERYLSRSWLDPLDEGLLLESRAAFRRAQRRFEEALELIDGAIAIYREVNEPHLQGRALTIKGIILQYSGDFQAAADCFHASLYLLDGVREPRLTMTSQFNLISCLQDAGRSADAAVLIPEARRLIEQVGKHSDLLRLRWTEGRVAASLHRYEQAEEALREVRDAFVESALAFDVALVSLDLAAVYLRLRRSEETKRLAAEMIPIFQSREVYREALAALIVFQRAAEMEQLTVSLVDEVSAYLRQAQGNPQLRFRGDR